MPYKPPGGRDWNRNGRYDWSDRKIDCRVYEIITGKKHPLDPDAKKQSKTKSSSSSYSRKFNSTNSSAPTEIDDAVYEPIRYEMLIDPSYRGEWKDEEKVRNWMAWLQERKEKYSSLERKDLIAKKGLLRDYNNILPCHGNLPWLYFAKHPEKGTEAATLLRETVKKYCDLLLEVLQTENGKKEVQEKLYLWSCEACEMFCKEGLTVSELGMFKYRTVYRQIMRSYSSNNEILKETRKVLEKADKPYKLIISTHVLCVEQIMKCLDNELFVRSPILQSAFCKVAEAYDATWDIFINRYLEFGVYPEEETITAHWRCYQSILDHLSQKSLDSLKETGWLSLMNRFENSKDKKQLAEFAASFRQSIQEQRAERRKLECEAQISQFKTERPNICKKIEKLETEKKKKEQVLEKENAAQEGLEGKIQITKDKIRDLQDKMQENQEEIQKLSKKIFGKRKALEQIQDLETAQKDIQNQSDLAEAELRNLEQLHRHQKKRCSEQQERIRKVSRQISEIKEKNHFLE